MPLYIVAINRGKGIEKVQPQRVTCRDDRVLLYRGVCVGYRISRYDWMFHKSFGIDGEYRCKVFLRSTKHPLPNAE